MIALVIVKGRLLFIVVRGYQKVLEIAFGPGCLTVIGNGKLKCSWSGLFGRIQPETLTFVENLHINVGVVLSIILTIVNSSFRKKKNPLHFAAKATMQNYEFVYTSHLPSITLVNKFSVCCHDCSFNIVIEEPSVLSYSDTDTSVPKPLILYLQEPY